MELHPWAWSFALIAGLSALLSTGISLVSIATSLAKIAAKEGG